MAVGQMMECAGGESEMMKTSGGGVNNKRTDD